MSVKILLDTDIGSDVDDAFCLAYLLAQPRCELLGITTVCGESQKRAMLASSLCMLAEKDIPIFPGAEIPLIIPQRQKIATQAKILKNWEHKTVFPEGKAIEFMQETIYKYPNEIILLTIGPLTNIALLFRTDPKIPGLLKGLVSMCGVFYNFTQCFGPIEWNASGDPHATSIVYNSPIKSHRSIGFDVTHVLSMDSKKIFNEFKFLKPVLEMSDVWFEKRDFVTFHDPLAAATIFDDNICTFSNGVIEVEIAKENEKGRTYWMLDEKNGRHQVAVNLNSSKFYKHFFSVFN